MMPQVIPGANVAVANRLAAPPGVSVGSVSQPARRAADGIATREGGFAQGPANQNGLNYGPAPAHIPNLFKGSMAGWAGVRQQGYEQNANQTLIMRRPRQPYATRGLRSVSGAINTLAGVRTGGNQHVPAIFVPTQAR